MSWPAWIAFLVASGLGAPARYGLDHLVQRRTGGEFPFGTLVVNVSGCLALGVLTGLGRYHHLDPTTATVVGTGGLGAFTTWSTFTVATVGIAGRGNTRLAVLNIIVTLSACLAAATLGFALASI